MEIQDKIRLKSMLSFVDAGSGAEDPVLRDEALRMLKETSRTFYIPISRLPDRLLEAVTSGYLCLRAIDEIEDHPTLKPQSKSRLLRNISRTIQSSGKRLRVEDLQVSSREFLSKIPQVTVRIPDWLAFAPGDIAHRIWDTTATMADRMADWVESGFAVHTEADLDRYTMGVAGAVGLLLSDLWAWYDGTQTDRGNAIGFGRGLQSVNILRNRDDDLKRGVDFFPDGWGDVQMFAYSRRNLSLADEYIAELPPGPVLEYCRIPLVLAYATLDAMEQGRPKLVRSEVMQLLGLDS
jgi:farnesyl-diphosphate farnesyltransferase